MRENGVLLIHAAKSFMTVGNAISPNFHIICLICKSHFSIGLVLKITHINITHAYMYNTNDYYHRLVL